MADPDPEDVTIPTVFVGIEDVPIQFANQFVIQHHQQEFILTVAQVAPPMLTGNDEEKLEQAKKIAYIPIKVVGRFGLTRERLAELIKVLQENLERFDRTPKGAR